MKKVFSILGIFWMILFVSEVKAQNLPDHAFGVYNAGALICKSNNGQYTFWYQGDGNLVLYNSAHVGLWNSGTIVSNPGSVTFDIMGEITCRTSTGQVYWKTSYNWNGLPCNPTDPGSVNGPDHSCFQWVLQDDGNFVGYFNIPNYAPKSVDTDTGGNRVSNHNTKIK
ncbi:hypothetical protein [Mucilaginibacter jinjuensis]|uniref:Bulb-type lectin domain-containing protein n=1 Tax=Mucilaginibacter jinjuensis TaxID=1176721 RepID=A0ABY7TBG9_9SPHI|nr:hypothetical protein [Mucilaginibacter jinjuensis]WCT13579.1 hypothetical protein PQO05_06465 [Mucilaginibacter jinjuensis]